MLEMHKALYLYSHNKENLRPTTPPPSKERNFFGKARLCMRMNC